MIKIEDIYDGDRMFRLNELRDHVDYMKAIEAASNEGMVSRECIEETL